jgi:hypothetical protein
VRMESRKDQLHRRPRVQLMLGGSADQKEITLFKQKWSKDGLDTVHLSIKAVMGTINQRIFGVHRTG